MNLEILDQNKRPLVRRDVDAVLFDLDGVITETADLHAKAWKGTFDKLLTRQGQGERDERFRPFEIGSDYLNYVDGKPREAGIRSFLASRRIELPERRVEGKPDVDSIQGIAGAKMKLFGELLDEHGAHVFPDAMAALEKVKAKGLKTALVSSSRNSRQVLRRAGIERFFDVLVDGNTAAEAGLRGKPEPDTFLDAARRLGVEPSKAAVVEDAIAGVQAGKRGHFGLVAGVARHRDSKPLLENGADVVVNSLEQLSFS